LGDVQKEIDYHEKALSISREIGNHLSIIADLGNLGAAYLKIKDIKFARQYLTESLEGALEVGDKGSEALGYWGLARCELDEGNLGLAKNMLQKAFDIFTELESPQAQVVKKMIDDMANDRVGNDGVGEENK